MGINTLSLFILQSILCFYKMKMKTTILRILIAVACLCSWQGAHAQLTTTTGLTAADLASAITGSGVTVYGATLVCGSNGSGKFNSIATCLPLDSGIILTTGAATGIGSPVTTFNSSSTGTGGDADLAAISGVSTNDKCLLEFNFVPTGDTIKFQYVFASEEYPEFACSSVNDAFGFFISGPGIVGTPNLALLPGTSTPVSINTVNNGGCGDPTYYVSNAGCTNLVYDGMTTILTAQYVVTPCDTYHLKLGIADGGDSIYDSGVFIKAGSLSSPSPTVASSSGFGGLAGDTARVLRGCVPGAFNFAIPTPYPFPVTIYYTVAGDATNGVDYSLIGSNVSIPAGSTTASVPIVPQYVPFSPAVEFVTLIVDSMSSGCTGATSISIQDSATIAILDTVPVQILTPDTSVCIGNCVDIQVSNNFGDTMYRYFWTSSATGTTVLDTTKNYTACLTGGTTYTLNYYVPLPGGSNCDTFQRDITITIAPYATVYAGEDDTTCLGTPITLAGFALPDTVTFDYLWTGAGGISPATSNIATFDPPAVGTFNLVLTASPTGPAACFGSDTVQIYVLPNDITLNTTDTTVCQGACVQVSATGHDLFSYLWSPSAGISNPTAIAPLICPPTADTFHYTLTASYPNCPDINKYLTITVEPQPSVFLGPDREKCQWDTLHLHAQVSPADYSAYTYLWSPDSVLSAVNTPNVIFSSDDSAMVLVSVSTPHGCSAKDSMAVFTHSGNFAALLPAQDTGICPGASVPLLASGGVFYQWSPAYFLSDPQSGSTVATPTADVAYTVLVTDQYGCYDTLGIAIDVRPAAVVDLGDSIDLYPGDSIRMDPKGNALYFSWFPHLGLSNPNIANPVAMPSVNTRYFVNATTEWGCTTTDSVDVIVHLDSELDMPNAFVPGNGPNGQIKAVHLGIAELKYLRIFNRWGQKVFETSDINAGWDGTLNGKPQPMGVYIYTVEGKTFRGKTVKKQGNITLIR